MLFRGQQAHGQELQAFPVKGGNEAFRDSTALLKKALRYADLVRKVQYPPVFFRGDGTAQFGEIGYLRHGCVLVHNADIDIISKGFMEKTEYFFRVSGLAGKNQMTHDNSALHQAGCRVDYGVPGLSEHFRDGFGCSEKIIRGLGISC